MIRTFIISLLFCCSMFPAAYAASLDTLAIDFAAPQRGTDLRPYLQACRSCGDSLPPPGAFTSDTAGLFHATKKMLSQPNDVWLRITVHNTGQKAATHFLFAGWQDDMTWYAPGKQPFRTGLMEDRGNVDRWSHFGFPLTLAPGETGTYYLHIRNRFYRENELMPVFFDAAGFAEFRSTQDELYKREVFVIQMLLGMLLILLSITIINHMQLPDRASLYFAVYMLGLILFFALRLETKPFALSFFSWVPLLKYYWDVPGLLFCFYMMQFLFARTFLGLRERYPLMNNVFRYGAVGAAILVIVCIALMAAGDFITPGMIYTWTYLISMLPLGISFVALARRTRHHPLMRFYLFGAISLYLLSIWAFVANAQPTEFTPLPELVYPYHAHALVLGVLLQAMFFAAGLSYRNKLLHQEKTKTQELLIRQLNKNKELQRKLNARLEELVREQTTEIVRKKNELEEQRKLQMDIEYSKKLAEIELKAIRAQINPHFIFNCLNSIQLFVMQRDFDHAQKYLSDFSYLIRKTLDFSRRNFISLSDEITYLNTYLGLEKMRFEQKMRYEIIVDPQIATSELEVPAMLLQPYVENAVKHGMTNEDHATGLLTLRFMQVESDMLACEIEDNGIGIERSRQLRATLPHHQSSGMEISLNRAELLNTMYNTDIQIEIIDKSSLQANDSGTVVRILIPQL
ncbi:histidine kinase [Chitinophaga lutea]